MKVIYVAGKYRGASENEVYENIHHARTQALKLWHQNWCVICPHLNSSFMSCREDETEYLDGGLELVRRSDAIYMLSGWQASVGACAELAEADRLGLPVYYESPL